MLVIAGLMEIDPDHFDAFVAAAKVMMAETMANDEGCAHYVFSADVEKPSHLRLFEEWDTREHLDAHLASPHLAAFREATPGMRLWITADTYEVSSKGNL
jgi:quinol monooxygenase YgiN